MWLKSMVDDVVYVPRTERISIDLEVPARLQGSRVRVLLKDLTCEGAKIDSMAGLRYDDVISLNLPSLKPKDAYVVWVKAGSAGLAFDRPLHPEVFAQLVRKHATVAGHARKPSPRKPAPALHLAA